MQKQQKRGKKEKKKEREREEEEEEEMEMQAQVDSGCARLGRARPRSQRDPELLLSLWFSLLLR